MAKTRYRKSIKRAPKPQRKKPRANSQLGEIKLDGSETVNRDEGNSPGQVRPFSKVFVNPVAPLHEIVKRVSATMDRGPDVVAVIGLPKRVYCFRHPEAIAQIFTDRETGGAKYLPRVGWLHWFYRSGGFARPIDDVWRQRRRAVQPSFSQEALTSILPAFQAVVEERTADWCARLRGNREITVDMFRECWEMIVDANFRAFFSTILGDRLTEVTSMSQYVERNFVQPLPLWLPLNRNRRFKRDGGGLRQLFGELLARRRTEGGGASAMCSICSSRNPKRDRRWLGMKQLSTKWRRCISACA